MITWQTCDVFDGLATLEDGSIDLVVTSPPFLALRSYLPADHPDKGKEIGSEATPAEFLGVMLRVVGELRRVLAPHGSIAIELGDTYAGSGGAGGDYAENGLREGQPVFRQVGNRENREPGHPKRGWITDKNTRTETVPIHAGAGWPLSKSKTLIPELFRVALAYGFNPLTGLESPAGRWRVRNVVTWARPNPPVGALGDKWRPATSDIVVACVSPKRFWDDLVTRKPYLHPNHPQIGKNHMGQKNADKDGNWGTFPTRQEHPSGAPLLDYWEIPPTGYSGAHYAVYPPALVEPLVKAMAPQRVCRTCGEPSRRIVSEPTYEPSATYRGGSSFAESERLGENVNQWVGPNGAKASVVKQQDTLGWTSCGHDDWRPGRVLDPFAGSGTTLSVASGHGHDAIGFDLDSRNEELARDRVGPLLWQEGP